MSELARRRRHQLLVLDPDDGLESRDLLRRWSDIGAGRLACRTTAASRTTFGLAEDILEALGKDQDRIGAGREGRRSRLHVLCWLVAEGITDLALAGSEALDNYRRQWLIEIAAACKLRLWLFTGSELQPRAVRRFKQQWQVEVVGLHDFTELWAPELGGVDGSRTGETAAAVGPELNAGFAVKGRALRPNPNSEAADRFPPVPDSDFVTFLADCRDVLSAGDFSTAQATFQAARREVRGAAAALVRAREIDQEALAEVLRQLVADARSRYEAITQLRAAQAEFFLHDLLLKVDVEAFASAQAEEATPKLTEAAVAEIKSYASPRHAALALCAALTGCRSGALTKVRLGHLSAGGDEVRIGGADFAVPNTARSVLRALRLQRTLEGAGESDALFVTEDSGRPALAPGLQNLLRRISLETGLRLATTSSSGSVARSRWCTRRGVALQWL